MPTLTRNPADILPPSNDPRDSRDSAHIDRMAAHLLAGGKLAAITIFINSDGNEETLVGENRRLAYLKAGLPVPVEVRDGPFTESDIKLDRLRENEWRVEFSLLERARLYVDLMRLNGWSQTELADAVGEKPSFIAKTLRISKKLIPALQARVATGELPAAHAWLLSHWPEDQQLAKGEQVIREGWRRDRLEKEYKKLNGKRARKPKPVKLALPNGTLIWIDGEADADAVEEDLKSALARVRKGKKIGEADEESAPVLLPAG